MTQTTILLISFIVVFLAVSVGFAAWKYTKTEKNSPKRNEVFQHVVDNLMRLMAEVMPLIGNKKTDLEIAKEVSKLLYKELTDPSTPIVIRSIAMMTSEDQFFEIYQMIIFEGIAKYKELNKNVPLEKPIRKK